MTDRIIAQPIEEEMTKSFTDYSLSVVVARALPDARDGLKPVHRRILYAMHHLGYRNNQPFKKSARVVGDVMGRFHPHGDSAIYEAMVRMAQDFSLRLPLIEGQGNFGSIDGDSAAAMRYTEARLSKSASLMVEDLVTSKKDDLYLETVAFRPNYDESMMEPTVLPTRFPNLLVNGSEGIAVGMATKIPPHNPVEAIDAALLYLSKPACTIDDILAVMPGPDFPTGAHIMGRDGIRQAYETGRGAIVLRAIHEFEQDKKGRQSIVFSALPYQVNKAELIKTITQLSVDKKIEGINEVRDESDRRGMRMVVELKRDADPHRVLAQLHKQTNVQTTFSVNAMAIDGGRPVQMGVRDMLRAFIDFRREVIRRRTRFFLKKALERGHELIGLAVALDHLDRVITIIRGSTDADEAMRILRAEPMNRAGVKKLLLDIEADDTEGPYHLSEAQVRVILDMRLQRLTGLERTKVVSDAEAVAKEITECRLILTVPKELDKILREELNKARGKVLEDIMASQKDKPKDQQRIRLTEIREKATAYREEDLIQKQDVVVTLTHSGYVKWVPLTAFRSQRRGGAGKIGMAAKDDDAVSAIVSTNTHAPLVCFTDRGIAYGTRVYQLPEGTPQSKGRPIINFMRIQKGERIIKTVVLPTDEEKENKTLLFVTKNGYVRRTDVDQFTEVQANGKIAMKLEADEGEPEDAILDVLVCTDADEIVLMTERGMAARLDASDVRVFASRDSVGVRGIKLDQGDRVLAAAVVSRDLVGDENADAGPALLTVTERGFAKRTPIGAYRKSKRGSKGVSDRPDPVRCGAIVTAFLTMDGDDIMLMTLGGTAIRTKVDEIRMAGRNSLGVRLLKLKKEDAVSAAIRVLPVDDKDEDGEGAEGNDAPEAPATE